MKTFTDLEQSKKLFEFLSDKNADLVYLATDGRGVEYFEEPSVIDGVLEDTDIPCWSLAALLAVVPKKLVVGVEIVLVTPDENKRWCAYGRRELLKYSHYASNPIDAVVELILELKEKNII